MAKVFITKEARKHPQRETSSPVSHKEEAASHPGGHEQQASLSSLHSLIQRIVYSEADSVLASEGKTNQQSWLLAFPKLIGCVFFFQAMLGSTESSYSESVEEGLQDQPGEEWSRDCDTGVSGAGRGKGNGSTKM